MFFLIVDWRCWSTKIGEISKTIRVMHKCKCNIKKKKKDILCPLMKTTALKWIALIGSR